MSREEYTPPDLSAKDNTSASKALTTANNTTTSSSNTNTPASSSTTTQPQPATTTTKSIFDLGIDFSRDDRGGRRPLGKRKYDASKLQYNYTSTTREDEYKKVQWECANCSMTYRFGPTDYLKCRECEAGHAFLKVRDYKRMEIGDRTFWAR